MIRHDGALKSAVARDTKGGDKTESSIRRQPSQDSVFLAWAFDSLNEAVDAAVRYANQHRSAGKVTVVMQHANESFPDSSMVLKMHQADVKFLSAGAQLRDKAVTGQVLNEVTRLLNLLSTSAQTTALPTLKDGEAVKIGPAQRPSKEDRQKFVDEEVHGRHLAY